MPKGGGVKAWGSIPPSGAMRDFPQILKTKFLMGKKPECLQEFPAVAQKNPMSKNEWLIWHGNWIIARIDSQDYFGGIEEAEEVARYIADLINQQQP